MSDIIKAREIIKSVVPQLDDTSKRMLRRALALMYREHPVRRAPARRQVIDAKLRHHVRKLARTKLTSHEIANVTGLRSSGRVSEILHGKR